MHKIQNLPPKFETSYLSNFNFGSPDGKDDPLLEACALKISPIAEFLDENKSILVGDRGAGKTAVFRLLSERKLSFVNTENLKQVYIPIDEDLGYKTLREHVNAQVKDADEKSSYRIIWELFIFSRCLDGLNEVLEGNTRFAELKKSFFSILGWNSQRKIRLIDVILNTKKTFGVKLEGGHLGYVIPNFYASVEPKKQDEESIISSNDLLDFPKLKSDLNNILSSAKIVAYVLIDKLDEFVSGLEYQTQLDTIQALVQCWRDYQSYPKIKIKLFLRRDLYERLDFSAIGKDKIDPRKVELKWADEDIRQLIALRVLHNMNQFLKGKSIRFECEEESLKIDKIFLREIRAIDAYSENEKTFVKRLKRLFLYLRAKIRQRSLDAYDARATNVHDMIYRALITVFFPRLANHKGRGNKDEQIELMRYFETHFQLSNGNTTPRTILLFMQKCLEVARPYYRKNSVSEIAINERSEYPVFLRDHLCEAYNDIRLLTLQTIIGLSHQWSRPATLLMQHIYNSKSTDSISYKDAKKAMDKSGFTFEPDGLPNFFAFYEHAGLFYCSNRTQSLESRNYAIPIIFQRVYPSVS